MLICKTSVGCFAHDLYGNLYLYSLCILKFISSSSMVGNKRIYIIGESLFIYFINPVIRITFKDNKRKIRLFFRFRTLYVPT